MGVEDGTMYSGIFSMPVAIDAVVGVVGLGASGATAEWLSVLLALVWRIDLFRFLIIHCCDDGIGSLRLETTEGMYSSFMT